MNHVCVCLCVHACVYVYVSPVHVQYVCPGEVYQVGLLGGLCLLSSLIAVGMKLALAFAFLNLEAQVVRWVPRNISGFLHCPLLIEMLKGRALHPTQFRPHVGHPAQLGLVGLGQSMYLSLRRR